MDKKELNNLIFLLLLIKQNGKQKSYAIIRTMARRFAIFNFLEVLNFSVSQGFVLKKKEDNIDVIEITQHGEQLVKSVVLLLKERLYLDFPLQSDFLDLLFKN